MQFRHRETGRKQRGRECHSRGFVARRSGFHLTFFVVYARLVQTISGCDVYLAPSSIKEAGLGVFAGRHIAYRERIGPPGLGIQVVDPQYLDPQSALFTILWHPGHVGGFSEAGQVRTFLPGIGSLAKHHTLLSNLHPGGLAVDPHERTGARTAYHNFTFIATRNISAGEELFVDKGQEWSKKIDSPLPTDYQRADRIVSKLCAYRDKHNESISEMLWMDILYRIRTEIMLPSDRVATLIPRNLQELELAELRGTARYRLDHRDIFWVQKNGFCLDNIEEGPSFIAGAGQGAFARRPIQKGELIAPAPLLSVSDRSMLEISQRRKSTPNATKQLLTNYCFGHESSNLLLCPLSHATLINHKANDFNAQVRWPTTTFDAAELLRLSPNELGSHLMLIEFVATRDIEQGEEIFLNYGVVWEKAWLDHHKSAAETGYVPAAILNQERRPIVLSSNKSFFYAYQCQLGPNLFEHGRSDVEEEDFQVTTPSVLNDFRFHMLEGNDHAVWHPCDIVGIEGDSFRTRVYGKKIDDHRLLRRFRGVPRSAIRFVDKAYHSYQHRATSFRHWISVDDLFPSNWKSYAKPEYADELTALLDFRGDKQCPEKAQQGA